MTRDLVTVNVITGFLGSGKTTLLQHLLRDSGMADTAVLINEIGEVGLDHHLLERVDESTVLLQSGCLCCTIRGDLAVSMKDLFSRRERGQIPRFRRLVIETTGLADPAPVIYTLMAEDVIRHHFRLGNVVTTVDAVNGARQHRRHDESRKQIAVADRIVITKTDLADGRNLAALEDQLRRLNPSAPRFDSQTDCLTAAKLLTNDVYDPRTKSNEVARWIDAEAFSEHDHARDSTRGLGRALGRDHTGKRSNVHADDINRHDINRHDGGIHAFCLTFDTPMDWTAFGLWLSMLLQRHGEDVLRVKGLLHVAGMKTPVAVHGVQHIVHPPIHLPRWPDRERRSRIVFIVRNLSREDIEGSLSAFNALGARAAA